ncbi:hypothetical protein PIB19_12720 [Sphingomonas sp. 7/4-4]|uniref:hypothetical protein n=1 Tax=Sphingomonas sp. 7/4-4 TaxID=3018446 RepID=UPI0022F3DCDF|nr:hypothetical protein [Sphingomonas sp. 7/4-4]WBY06459.1 hypothetical protein PIB19_12720 [Sphingomonas sp. 7/4-4]
MDVNGLPMWELSGRADFGLAPSAKPPFIADRLHFKDALGHVVLSEKQPAPALTEVETWSRMQASAPSPVTDQLGGFAWWDGATRTVQSSGFAPGAMQLFPPDLDPPYDEPPSMIGASDLALGDDDILYIARDGALTWRDLRDRWRPARIFRDDFRADLIAPMPGGGAWVFDKLHRRLGRARGYPLQFAGLRDADPAQFDPVEPNRNPPRLIRARVAPLASEYEVVAMAASAGASSPCWRGSRARTPASSPSKAMRLCGASGWRGCASLIRWHGRARIVSRCWPATTANRRARRSSIRSRARRRPMSSRHRAVRFIR